MASVRRMSTVVFTVTSDGYKYFTWNLWKNLQAIGVPWKLTILCLDRESLDFFNRIALVPAKPYFMDGPRGEYKTPSLFGSSHFKRLNRMKLKALEEYSQKEELDTLIYIDSDIYVFQDIVPLLQKELESQPLLFQCDEKVEGRFDCSEPGHCPNPCTGVIAMRLSDRETLKKLYSLESETWKKSLTDQDYIAGKLLAFSIPYGTLDRPTFPNGIFLAGNRYTGSALLHFNYILGIDKKRMMKNKGCWLLEV
jgi:hypothetical protein